MMKTTRARRSPKMIATLVAAAIFSTSLSACSNNDIGSQTNFISKNGDRITYVWYWGFTFSNEAHPSVAGKTLACWYKSSLKDKNLSEDKVEEMKKDPTVAAKILLSERKCDDDENGSDGKCFRSLNKHFFNCNQMQADLKDSDILKDLKKEERAKLQNICRPPRDAAVTSLTSHGDPQSMDLAFLGIKIDKILGGIIDFFGGPEGQAILMALGLAASVFFPPAAPFVVAASTMVTAIAKVKAQKDAIKQYKEQLAQIEAVEQSNPPPVTSIRQPNSQPLVVDQPVTDETPVNDPAADPNAPANPGMTPNQTGQTGTGTPSTQPTQGTDVVVDFSLAASKNSAGRIQENIKGASRQSNFNANAHPMIDSDEMDKILKFISKYGKNDNLKASFKDATAEVASIKSVECPSMEQLKSEMEKAKKN